MCSLSVELLWCAPDRNSPHYGAELNVSVLHASLATILPAMSPPDESAHSGARDELPAVGHEALAGDLHILHDTVNFMKFRLVERHFAGLQQTLVLLICNTTSCLRGETGAL